MKKTFFSLLLFLFALQGLQAQIDLVHSFQDQSASITSMNDGSIKYYSMKVSEQQCLIYSENFNLEKTVNISVPDGYDLYDIQYVTDKLFDPDELIEMAVTYYRYDQASYYYEYGGMIINENGNILLHIPGSSYFSLIQPTETTYNLFSWIYDYSVYPYGVETRIYTLPGTWVSSGTAEQSVQQKAAWPNPVTDKLMLPVPENTQDIALKLYDINGKAIKTLKIQNPNKTLKVNTTELSPGTYQYSLQSAEKIISTGTFIKR